MHENCLYKSRRRSTGQQPGPKSGRRLANKPRIDRLLTADKPVVNRGFCFSIGFYRISFVRASEESSSCLRFFEKQESRLFPGRTNPPASRSAPPRTAPHRPAPPRTAPPCPVPSRLWYVRFLDSTGEGKGSSNRRALRSSGLEERRTPIFDLRSWKNEEPP